MKNKILLIGRNGVLNPDNGNRFIYVYAITKERLNRIRKYGPNVVNEITSEISNYFAPYVKDNYGNKKYIFIEKKNNEVLLNDKPLYFIDEDIVNSSEEAWINYLLRSYKELSISKNYSEIEYEALRYSEIFNRYCNANLV